MENILQCRSLNGQFSHTVFIVVHDDRRCEPFSAQDENNIGLAISLAESAVLQVVVD